MEKDAGCDGQAAVHRLDGHRDPELGEDTGREVRKPSVNERLKDVLNKPREKLEIEDDRDQGLRPFGARTDRMNRSKNAHSFVGKTVPQTVF